MKKMLTPSDLQAKSTPITVTGKYDWKKQTYEFDSCKFGTISRTSSQTCSGQFNMLDDNPSDSFTD